MPTSGYSTEADPLIQEQRIHDLWHTALTHEARALPEHAVGDPDVADVMEDESVLETRFLEERLVESMDELEKDGGAHERPEKCEDNDPVGRAGHLQVL